MRPARDTLEYLLGTNTKAHAIRRIFETHESGDRTWIRDVYRGAGIRSMSSVVSEVRVLMFIGLVKMRKEGGAAFLELSQEHPLYEPLRDLVVSSRTLDETDWLAIWRQVGESAGR